MNDTVPATSTDSPAISFVDIGGWPEVLSALVDGEDLDRSVARAAMAQVLAGEATNAQIAALVIGLSAKGESTDEMVGMVEAMLAASEPLTLPDDVIDIVGTGGSAHRRAHALNVSTMSSFVAAAAGAVVCKHGNYKASSTSGSFDFLQQLGVAVDLGGEQLAACVDRCGIGFALARQYHPAMRHAGPVRAELGIPTVFNLLGPVAHPGQVGRQVIGTANERLAHQLADVSFERGATHVWVVTGAGGLDELSTTGPSVILEVTPAGIERREIDLSFLGITPPDSMEELSGGDAAANVAIFERILDGRETGARADIVALNAGAGLVVAGVVGDLASGIHAAREVISDRRAAAKVAEVVEVSQELARAASE